VLQWSAKSKRDKGAVHPMSALQRLLEDLVAASLTTAIAAGILQHRQLLSDGWQRPVRVFFFQVVMKSVLQLLG
jgi:hypothetical protein